MGTKYERSKVVMDKPYCTLDDETEIYDFRVNNLYPTSKRIPLYSNGYLATDGKDIRAQFNGRSFLTKNDPLLYAGLYSSVARWKVNRGTRKKEKLSNNPMLVCGI